MSFSVLDRCVVMGYNLSMSERNGYQHLASRPESNYKQLFVEGTRIRAMIVARALTPDPDENYFPTAADVAADFNIPVDAVIEAVRYCETQPNEIARDFRSEALLMEAHNMTHPDYKNRPQELYRPLSTDDRLRIEQQLDREFGKL